MGRARILNAEQLQLINDERIANNWSVKGAAKTNTIMPGINNVTLYLALKKAGMITVKSRKKAA